MSTETALSIQELSGIFSPERISRLQDIYALSVQNSILLHEQLSALNGTIHASTSILEIHLRNIALYAIKSMYGDDWIEQSVFKSDPWLQNAINRAIKSAQKNNYSKLSHATRAGIKATFPGNPAQKNLLPLSQ